MSFMTRDSDLISRLAGLNELRKSLTPRRPQHDQKVRIHLGEHWWADMEVEQALRFVDRRQADILHWLQPNTAWPDGRPSLAPEVIPSSSGPASAVTQTSSASKSMSEPVQVTPQPLQVLSEVISGMLEPAAGHAEGVEVTQDGEVLNEEGEPFLEIREPVAAASTTPNPLTTSNPSSSSAENDDYWSPAAVERRRRLRQQVLASDSEDEREVEDDEQEEEEHEESGATNTPQAKTSPPLPKTTEHPPVISTIPGRMVRSTIIHQDGRPAPILKEILPPSRPDTPKKSVSFAPKSEVSDGAGTVSEVITKKEDIHTEPARTNSFAGFKRGFLMPAPDAVATTSNAVVLSSRSPNAEPPAIPVIHVNGEESPSTPTIADAPAPRPAKKQSLFSQRKAQARAANEAPSKPAVVKPPAKPVMQSEVQERVSEAPPVIKSLSPAIPAAVGPSRPLAKKRESASDKVFKGRVLEKAPTPKAPASKNPPSIAAVNVGPTPRNPSIAAGASTLSHDDDSDREILEYSDNDDNAFDMDEAMLAREAALEYHAKRAEMGRRGLGGWTGGVREDGQVEWDQTAMNPHDPDDDTHHSEIVGFGERVLPTGLLNTMTRSSEGLDESISLPTVVPASASLASAIRTGKLEDGRLVIPAGEDSDDSEDNNDDSGDPDSTFGRERREAHARKKEMMRRMLMGDWRELAAEEEKDRLADTISPGPIPDQLPIIASTPSVGKAGKMPRG